MVGLTAWQAPIEKPIYEKGRRCSYRPALAASAPSRFSRGQTPGRDGSATTTSTDNGSGQGLGADTVIDYKQDDFENVLSGYDVVLNSLDKVTLEKSLRVLKPGGKLISISGPPDAAFARSIGASWVLRMVTGALSYRIRAKAKRRQVHYSFLFMRANGDQLTEITSLIDDGIIRPVVDRVFPFASTKEAMAYVEVGRAKGKVVVSLK